MKASPGKRVLMLLENSQYADDFRVRGEAETLAAHGYQVSVINSRSRSGRFHEVIDGVHLYTFMMPNTSSGILGYFIEYLYAMVAMFVLSCMLGCGADLTSCIPITHRTYSS